jgi:hypothetical protein
VAGELIRRSTQVSTPVGIYDWQELPRPDGGIVPNQPNYYSTLVQYVKNYFKCFGYCGIAESSFELTNSLSRYQKKHMLHKLEVQVADSG